MRGDGLAVFKFDASTQQFSAHCNFPSHGRLCRLRRTVKASTRNDAQGRPGGLLLAWVANAELYSSLEEHQAAGQKGTVEWQEWAQFEHRARHRQAMRGKPVSAALQGNERARLAGEGEEPVGFA